MSLRAKAISISIILAIVFASAYLWTAFYQSASNDATPVVVNIPKGTGFNSIAAIFEKNGIIRDKRRFILAGYLLGAHKKARAGEYELSPNMAPKRILDLLIAGKVKTYRVTIPEGFGIKEIGIAVAQTGLVGKDDFIRRASDERLVVELGFEGKTLEGYLYPDTYSFIRGDGADEMIRAMAKRFKEVYSGELGDMARKSGVSTKRLVTLASIIEKETGAPQERPLISSVFHNRLSKGMRLQSDPTVIYALPYFDGNLRKRDLSIRNPYNTYVYAGLPPGPIASPGKDSLWAALNPAKTDYLYFVSKGDGSHYFSRDLNEHNRAVREYQRAKRTKAAITR